MITRRRLLVAASAAKAFALRLAAQVARTADLPKGRFTTRVTQPTRFIVEAPLGTHASPTGSRMRLRLRRT
jgi:hypothetical protein